MKPSELYKLWAPENSLWSAWAKPVLFADPTYAGEDLAASDQWRSLDVTWAPAAQLSPVADGGTAIILDLPGGEGIAYGLALSQCGYRPVPLYNGAAGRSALVSVADIVQALHSAADDLTALSLPAEAPPVFLLDAHRLAGGAQASPGMFDNRWYVFPQDFPSANLLLSRGIRSVVLGQLGALYPQKDLAHVLLRWQEAGIQINACAVDSLILPAAIEVEKPDKFRALWYQALVLMGLRRNSTGGFGGVVPEPGSGGGYG